MSTSVSSLSVAISKSFSPLVLEHMENFLSSFALEVSSKLNIEEQKLVEIWNNTCAEKFKNINMEALIDKAKRKQKAQETREKKLKENPVCEFINANDKQCESASKEIFEEKHYCNKHFKQLSSKHTCEYIKKDKSVCGHRVKGGVDAFKHDGNEYDGKFLCSNHISVVNKGIERLKNRCIHVSKTGKQCTSSKLEDSDVCKKHSKDAQEKKEKETKVSAIKGNKKSKEEKLPDINLEIDFSLKKNKPHAELQFVNRIINDTVVFIDMNSGLVCHNPDNTQSTKASNDQLVAIGVWNSDVQSYDKIDASAIKYAKAHKLKYDDEDN
jgi:hypothetical protein